MAADAFRAKLARIEALRTLDDDAAVVAALRKALRDRSSYAVAKAAAVAADRTHDELLPDLLAAYDRLFDASPGVDPLAVGKIALARALAALAYREPAAFVRGLRHIQLEPVWGGAEDHAGPLRAVCAQALVACDIGARQLLETLIDQAIDADREVRVEVVRAIAQIGGDESVLLLRLKAVVGDPDADVTGTCLVALLEREPRESVDFVRGFLGATRPDVALEAACALASSRVEAALDVALAWWSTELALDVRRSILFALGASPLARAAEFLLGCVGAERGELAVPALSALAASRFARDLRERAGAAARRNGDAAVGAAFTSVFAKDRRSS